MRLEIIEVISNVFFREIFGKKNSIMLYKVLLYRELYKKKKNENRNTNHKISIKPSFFEEITNFQRIIMFNIKIFFICDGHLLKSFYFFKCSSNIISSLKKFPKLASKYKYIKI